MQAYVVGFLFNDEKSRVALIEKNRPDWQKGKLNGIGGKVWPSELPSHSMVREFEEETGVLLTKWELFAVLRDALESVFVISFFFAISSNALDKVTTNTEEKVIICDIDSLPGLNIVNNLNWLIPMALSMDKLETSRTEVNYFSIREY